MHVGVEMGSKCNTLGETKNSYGDLDRTPEGLSGHRGLYLRMLKIYTEKAGHKI
jgi:hypothetical protein